MNKVIIIGHPDSGYERVESLLQRCGMCAALPSLHEKLTATDIDCALCKAHGVLPINLQGREIRGPIKQIEIAPVWNGMVMDLVRGNLEQPFWGWADPAAVHLLDFWLKAVPDLMFVLVYSHPSTVLPRLLHADTSDWDDDKLVGNSSSSWRYYNETLLRFYHQNADRCLLMHSDCADNAEFEQVKTLIGLPGNTATVPAGLKEPTNSSNESAMLMAEAVQTNQHSNRQTNLVPAMSGDNSGSLSIVTSDTGDVTPLMHFLADALSSQSPGELEVYEELQAVATLPYRSTSRLSQVEVLKAWRSLGVLLHEKQHLAAQTQELNSRLVSLAQHSEKTALICKKQTKDNEALLAHMLETQEILEAEFAENKIIKSRVSHLEKAERDANRMVNEISDQLQQVLHRHPLGAAQRLQEDLPYQIGTTILAHGRSVWKLLFLPISLWFVAKRCRKKKRLQALPPIPSYDDYDVALKKVSSHLSFRLGKAWLKHIHKPWCLITMPWALLGAYIGYRRQRGASD